MRNRIFRAYVHRAMLGIYISRDRRTIIIIIIIIYIQFAHSCTVYVGLAQARPNYYYKTVYNNIIMRGSKLCSRGSLFQYVHIELVILLCL